MPRFFLYTFLMLWIFELCFGAHVWHNEKENLRLSRARVTTDRKNRFEEMTRKKNNGVHVRDQRVSEIRTGWRMYKITSGRMSVPFECE